MMILLIVALAVIVAGGFLYRKAAKALQSLDVMLDKAIDGTFEEVRFDESRISRLESKMQRYLTAVEVDRRQIRKERDGVKALISDISHQTKTPISTILLYTQLLRERSGLDEETQTMLKLVESQTEKLSFLIQSLVKTSRLETGIVVVQPRESQLKLLLCDVQMQYQAAAEKKGVTLMWEAEEGLSARFDPKWTQEALGNLVDNAIKYTPSGGAVQVVAVAYEMFVRVDVKDTGIGIEEQEYAQIFSRFYRSPAVAQEPGVGIGLYLAREIAALQGGYLKVKSALGKGSVFSLFLPR